MQVSPATRLITYLRDFAAVRPAEAATASRAPAVKEINGASAVAPAPAGAGLVSAVTARRSIPVQQPAPPAAAVPRLLPRGSLVNIIT